MATRIMKTTGREMVTTNVEVEKGEYNLLVLRAQRMGLKGQGNKTGVSKLLKLEISRVAAEERLIQHPPTFHDDDAKPCVVVPVNPPVAEVDEVAVANA